MRSTLAALIVAPFLLMTGHAAALQPAGEPGQEPAADPPSVVVGKRVLATRVQIPRVSTLVIATDTEAYVRAIGEWSLSQRFPVLIDDGTPEARHNIARFVRGYAPEQIVRLSGGGDEPSVDRIERAAASAWDAEPDEEIKARWSELGFTPPGIVVASETDPAWTAALALAADRGQPIVWLDHQPRSLDRIESEANASAWRASLRDRIDGLGWSWDSMGDELDALTVCLSMATKVRIDDRILAMTDYIGRNDDLSSWAVSGMIPGSEAQAAYVAMCSLFLQPRSVWLFDGYEGNFGGPSTASAPTKA